MPNTQLDNVLNQVFDAAETALEERDAEPTVREVGRVLSVGDSIARVSGLPNVQSEELIQFPDRLYGLAFNLDPGEVGVILLDEGDRVNAGDRVRRTGRVLDVPVGPELKGRVVDALVRPIDGNGPVRTDQRAPVEQPAPAIVDRAPVNVPLQTGIKVIDALIPVGRGQRELILGDRQTGKTAIARETILNQRDTDVQCIYCSIGQRASATAGLIEDLREHGAMSYTTVVVATENDPPGQQFVAPYTAMSLGEYYRDRGDDALVVFDDLTRHARAYRTLSLLLRRPPGREAYPGDIFYIHSRLLERSTQLCEELGGGSLTALPVIETQEETLSAYIPTNLISITDGQIYLSPSLHQKGMLPAVDPGKSVSRVGGKTQLPAYRAVTGDLRLSYAQFEELETFSHFGARLEEQSRKQLERGRRVREVFKQQEADPLPAAEQIAVLLAVTEGLFDDLPIDAIDDAEQTVRELMRDDFSGLADDVEAGKEPDELNWPPFLQQAEQILNRPEQ